MRLASFANGEPPGKLLPTPRMEWCTCAGVCFHEQQPWMTRSPPSACRVASFAAIPSCIRTPPLEERGTRTVAPLLLVQHSNVVPGEHSPLFEPRQELSHCPHGIALHLERPAEQVKGFIGDLPYEVQEESLELLLDRQSVLFCTALRNSDGSFSAILKVRVYGCFSRATLTIV